MVCLLREKNQLEQVQICSQLEIILTFSRKCLFYRIFTLPNFTLYLARTAFKNAWTGINILVVVTIFNWLPLIANKLIFLNSQSVFQESSDVTTRVKFSQKAPPFKFIQQLFWFSLGHNKNNQAKNSECQAGRVDTPMGQCAVFVHRMFSPQ